MKTIIMIFLAFFIWSCNITTTPDDTLPPATESKMKLLWEIPYKFVGSSIVASPLILGDSLVIMSSGKEIFAIEQNTGKIRWKYFVSNETNIQTNEFVSDGIRLYMSHVEDIRAVNISDGKEMWLISIPEDGGAFWTNTIELHQSEIFVTGYHNIYCINTINGNIIWNKKPMRGLYGSPIYYNGKLIVGNVYNLYDTTNQVIGAQGVVMWLDSKTGDTLFTKQTKGDGVLQYSILDNGNLFGGTYFPYTSGSFDAFNVETGEYKWSYYIPTEGWNYKYSIAIENRIITTMGLYWVAGFEKNTGQLLWRTFVAQNAWQGKLHSYNGYIYHIQGVQLYIINPTNGEIVHTLKPERIQISTIAVGNGKVFVCGHPTLQCYETYKPE